MKVLLKQKMVKQESATSSDLKILEEQYKEYAEKFEKNDFKNAKEREACFSKLITLGTQYNELLYDALKFNNKLFSNFDYESWKEITCSSCGAKYPKKYKRCPCCHGRKKY